MADIREQKLLYHLTALGNLESILERGLVPRNRMYSKASALTTWQPA